MPYLIDGYNLLMALRKLRLDEPPDILANERAWLARHLQELLEESGKTSETVTLVFDGGSPEKSKKQAALKHPQIKIEYSKEIDADTWIENHLARVDFPKEWTVISNDKRIIKAAKSKGATPMACLDFEFHLLEGPPPKKDAPVPHKPELLSTEQIKDWEKEFFPNPKDLEEFEGLSDPFFRKPKD